MTKNPDILFPVFALVAWTFAVLLRVAFKRFDAHLKPNDFKYGESAAVPPQVSIPNRNYMNLLEVPLLFYIACLLLYVAGSASSLALALAWLYLALRIIHSLIHLTYNNVIHRLIAFAASNAVLGGLWVCTWLTVTASA